MMMTPVGLSIESLLALHQRQRQAAQAAAMAASAAAAMHHHPYPPHPPVVPQCHHPGMTPPLYHSQCHQPVVNEELVGIKEDDQDSEDPDQQLLLDSSLPAEVVDTSHDEKNNNEAGEVIDEADEVRLQQFKIIESFGSWVFCDIFMVVA